MKHQIWGSLLGLVIVCVPLGIAEQTAIAPDLARIADGKIWNVINADATSASESDKTVVHMAPKGGDFPDRSSVGLALVQGLEFGEGTLEIDLKGKGMQERSFVGVAFDVVDGQTLRRFISDHLISRQPGRSAHVLSSTSLGPIIFFKPSE